jgi:hypothetical protein
MSARNRPNWGQAQLAECATDRRGSRAFRACSGGFQEPESMQTDTPVRRLVSKYFRPLQLHNLLMLQSPARLRPSLGG